MLHFGSRREGGWLDRWIDRWTELSGRIYTWEGKLHVVAPGSLRVHGRHQRREVASTFLTPLLSSDDTVSTERSLGKVSFFPHFTKPMIDGYTMDLPSYDIMESL